MSNSRMTRHRQFLNLSLATIILVSTVTISTEGYSQEKNDIWRLKKELFERRQYDKHVRPTNHEHAATEVTLQFNFARIKVDEINGNLLTHGWLSLLWNETSFKWRPREYNNLTYIKVPASEVWIPDIIVHNSYEGLNTYPDSLVNINHRGEVFHLQKLTVATKCDLDLTYWPLDKQTCSIRVGTWTSDATEVKPVLVVDEPEFSYFEAGNSPWEVVGAHSVLNTLKYTEDMIPRHEVVFSVDLERRSAFDVKMAVAPAVVISLLVLVTFWMTPGSPERIHVGSVAVVVNTMMLVYLRFVLPAAGNHVPLVVIFYVATLSLSAFGVFITLITGNLSRRSTSYKFHANCIRSHSQTNICTLSKGSLESERSLKMHDEHNSDTDSDMTTKTIPLASFSDSLPPPSFATKRQSTNWLLIAQFIDRISFVVYFLTILILSFQYLVL